MAQLQCAFWDGVGGYAEQDANMADVYDEHIRLVQRLEELGWHSSFVSCPVSDVERTPLSSRSMLQSSL